MKNSDKNRNLSAKGRFKTAPQPSPEAKSKGWERRREAQRIMDQAQKYIGCTYKDLKDTREDMKIHPEKYTVLEVKMLDYIMNNKYMTDWLDRHIAKAPQGIELSNKDGSPFKVEIIDSYADK